MPFAVGFEVLPGALLEPLLGEFFAVPSEPDPRWVSTRYPATASTGAMPIASNHRPYGVRRSLLIGRPGGAGSGATGGGGGAVGTGVRTCVAVASSADGGVAPESR